MTSCEQHALGVSQTNRPIKQTAIKRRIDNAKACRGNTHLSTGIAHTKMERERYPAPAPHSITGHRSNRRKREIADRYGCSLCGMLVNTPRFRVRANFAKFRNVGAGAKIAAGAPKYRK